MRFLSWNCRGLESLSTVSHFNDSIRLFKTGLMFISETKRKKGFVGTVGKKMGWGDRWFVVDSIGKSGERMLLFIRLVIQHLGGKCGQFLGKRSELSNDRSCYLERVTGATTGY